MDIVSELLEECKNFNISSDRVFSIINNKEFKKEKFGKEEIENIDGNFEFKNVKFGYNENLVLRGLNLKIDSGAIANVSVTRAYEKYDNSDTVDSFMERLGNRVKGFGGQSEARDLL